MPPVQYILVGYGNNQSKNTLNRTKCSESEPERFPGKEMFHPQVLLRIPCYDLLPISSLTVVPPNEGKGASGASAFHELTGGEYKTQELIHRSIADLRLLAIPTSCRRVAADNPN